MAVKKSGRKKTRLKAKTSKKAAKKPSRKAKKKAVEKPAKRAAKAAAAPKKQMQPQTPIKTLKRKEFLKKLLLRKRNEIVTELEEHLGRKLSVTPGQKIDSAMDSADLSTQDMDEGVTNSLLEMKYEQYKDIADAFRKLQNDTYGLCEECGAEIDIKRLEVNPLARYCIPCKTRKEEMEKIEREGQRFKGQ